MEKILLNVEGMSCSHCENAVKNSVGALDGVALVEVDLAAKTVAVEYDAQKASPDGIRKEIEDLGYDVLPS